MARELEQRIAMGERLRELRRPMGNGQYEIKQQTAADAAGVTLRAYQAWEGGESDIGWENLSRLSSYFKVDPYWIRDGPREPSQIDRIEAMLAALVTHLDIKMPTSGAVNDPARDATAVLEAETDAADQRRDKRSSTSATKTPAPHRAAQ